MNGKAISLFVCLAACLVMGCSDEGGEDAGPSPSAASFPELAVSIYSPATGSILSGDEAVKFEGEAMGGKKPYSYQWRSALDGTLSTEKSFAKPSSEMSKGRYVVILTATDDAGTSSQASITVTVL